MKMNFEVEKVEFEVPDDFKDSGKKYVVETFYECAKRYVPKIKERTSYKLKSGKVELEFNKPISLNTINNSLSLFKSLSCLVIKELEYEPEDKKVEVEIETRK